MYPLRVAALLFVASFALSMIGYAPRTASANDDAWDDRFGAPGVTCCAGFDDVYAIETVGNDVYMAGEFTSVGNLDGTQGIGRWDGRRWHALSGGLRRDGTRTGIANDIAVSGEDLYIVGVFDKAGAVAANGVARWNIPTQTWHSVGSGAGPQDDAGAPTSAAAVAVAAGEVYIGGGFDKVDGVAASRLAVWNGTIWSPLAGGVADEVAPGREDVFAIVVAGNLVYVGGEFELAVNPVGVADVRANNVAAWNRTTQRWAALGTGTAARVYALTLDGATLYAGGAFAGGVARWNGAQWQPLGGGVAGQVYSLHLAGGSLYVAGSFSAAGAVANTNSLAAWDGAQWRSLRSDLLFSDPLEDYINAVALLPDGKIFVAGDFNDSGRPLVSNIAFWDGTRWRGTGLGLEDGSTAFLGGDGYAVAVNDAGQVFVGGDFEELGGLPFSRIAMWDGSAWQDLGGGVDGDVSALLSRGDELYVAGGFSTVGNGITAVRVAKWNMRTKTWSAVGNGPPGGYVHALAFVGDTLYAGGNGFPSDVECCLWKFNGAAWAPFSQRFRTNAFFGPFGGRSTVLSLASDGQRLLVGGVFLDIEQRNPLQRFETNELFVYNPADDSVAAFGNGADNGTQPARVYAITIANDGIYVGGQFTSIAGTAALNIARLSGGGWSALGTGVLGEDVVVGAIAANGADIYVGGSFETVGVPAFNIARWNAQSRSWAALGCGIARNGETVSIERVASLAVQPQGLPNAGLYVAGGILEAGCKPSVGFAIYRDVGARTAPQTGRALLPFVQKR